MSKASQPNRSDESPDVVRPRCGPPVSGRVPIRPDTVQPQANAANGTPRLREADERGMDCGHLSSGLVDCLRRTEIRTVSPPPRAKRCVATVGSARYADLLDNLLGSIRANGGLDDALLVVFVVDGDPECLRIAENYGAQIIECRPLTRLGVGIKSVLYSVARVVDADEYLCLDADMLVLGDLQPVFQTLAACSENAILVCREGNRSNRGKLKYCAQVRLSRIGGRCRKPIGQIERRGVLPVDR